MRIVGIDLGIAKLAYAVWEDGLLKDTGVIKAEHLGDRGEQLHTIGEELYEAMHHLDPEYIVIEETLVGNNVKYSIKLAQVMGAVLAELHELNRDKQSDGAEGFGVLTVNVSTWKREVVGKGNVKKELVMQYLYERDSAYSVLCGNDQDRVDAACIGYYGHLVAERAEKLEALRRVR